MTHAVKVNASIKPIVVGWLRSVFIITSRRYLTKLIRHFRMVSVVHWMGRLSNHSIKARFSRR